MYRGRCGPIEVSVVQWRTGVVQKKSQCGLMERAVWIDGTAGVVQLLARGCKNMITKQLSAQSAA